MGVQVSLDIAAFRTLFPEFGPSTITQLTDAQITSYWNAATGYHANDGSGRIPTAAIQSECLNYLTAHIAYLMAIQDPNAPVGRISSASEGSVSVGTDNQYPPGTPQWFQQTKYGSFYWLLTSQFRTMSYRPGLRYNPNPYYYQR